MPRRGATFDENCRSRPLIENEDDEENDFQRTSLNLFQPVFQVFDNILPVFQANRKADAARFDSFGFLKFWRQCRVGHRKGVFNQSLYLPQTHRQSDRIGMVGYVINEFLRRFVLTLSVFLQDKINNASR